MVRNLSEREYKSLDADVRRMLQVQRGDTDAFAELLDRYEARVRNYLTQRVSDRQTAEDLTQEVFLRVFRARARYIPRSRFATWLFTIVNNVERAASPLKPA